MDVFVRRIDSEFVNLLTDALPNYYSFSDAREWVEFVKKVQHINFPNSVVKFGPQGDGWGGLMADRDNNDAETATIDQQAGSDTHLDASFSSTTSGSESEETTTQHEADPIDAHNGGEGQGNEIGVEKEVPGGGEDEGGEGGI